MHLLKWSDEKGFESGIASYIVETYICLKTKRRGNDLLNNLFLILELEQVSSSIKFQKTKYLQLHEELLNSSKLNTIDALKRRVVKN